MTEINNFQLKLDYYNSLPKYKQGSPEWLNQRHNYLTASTISTALGLSGNSARKTLLLNKASYGKYGGFTGNCATHHGNKFEPVANAIYSYINNVTINDFGMITNSKYPILGVSPDGILHDRMIEIKCPFSRVINGKIKSEYYHQMQEQMCVCEYNYCDFLECKFNLINESEFIDLFDDDKYEYFGAIILILNINTIDKSCSTQYLYSPIKTDKHILYEWINTYNNDELLNINNSDTQKTIYLNTTYWKNDKYNCQIVEKDPNWIIDNYPILENFWKEVLYYRDNGYTLLLDDLTNLEEDKTYKPNNKVKCLL